MDGDLDLFAMTGEVLVHRVVEHLGNAVMERAFVGTANVHAGLFTDGFQALELAQFIRVVAFGDHCVLSGLFGVGVVGH